MRTTIKTIWTRHIERVAPTNYVTTEVLVSSILGGTCLREEEYLTVSNFVASAQFKPGELEFYTNRFPQVRFPYRRGPREWWQKWSPRQ